MKSLKKLVLEDNVCPIPWVHVEIHGPVNEVFPCCKYKKNAGLIEKNFLPVWHNKEYQSIRADFLSNTKHENCEACNVSNDSFSYKKWKTKTYLKENLLDDIDVDNPSPPKVLHIGGFSNLCNLACRMCSPQNSSTLEHMFRRSDLKKYFPIRDLQNDLSIDAFDDIIDNITNLTIAGGEPFLDKKVFLFLKKFQNKSNLKKINFSTNLTKLNFELLDFLNESSVDVTISVSIDGSKNIHEYIRHNCDYDKIINNLYILNTKYSKFRINFNSTISAYNVGYVKEMLDSFLDISKTLDLKIKDLMISPVLNPHFLHPGIFPEEIKKIYLEKLYSLNLRGYLLIPKAITMITTAKYLLKQDKQNLFEKFLEYTKEFDKNTGTDYLKIYPELNF